jgi:uncharacterized RDD family membrane protein YckC
MQYYVGKNGQQLGPFGEEQIKARVASGEFSPSDLMWCDGMAAWEPISQVLNHLSNPYAPSPGLGQSPLLARNAADPRLAGLGARLGAAVLDGLLIFLCFLPALPAYFALAESAAARETGAAAGELPPEFNPATMILAGVLFLAIIVTNLVLLSTQGQTLGKKMVGVRIVRFEDGGKAGFVKAVLMRGFLPGLIGAIPVLGPVFSLVNICFIFREDRRCIHDLMAGTHVVEAGTHVVDA